MKTYLTFLLFLFSNIIRIFAAFDLSPETGKSLAMGRSLSAFTTGAEAMFLNPACLGGSKETDFCISYSRPFGLVGVDSWALAGHAAAAGLGLGLGFHGFGNAVYSEKTLYLAAAARIIRRFSAGLQARLMRLDIARYGSAGACAWDAGIRADFSEKTAAGLAFLNFARAAFGPRREALHWSFKAGMAWKPEPAWLCSAEWCRDGGFPGRFSAGVQFGLSRSFDVRFGFQSQPAVVSFGFGVNLEKTALDWGAAMHPVLGVTQACSMAVKP
jgi:hypothetical protein